MEHYDQLAEGSRRRPRPALGERTKDDALEEHPQMRYCIQYKEGPAKLKNLYRHLPKYVRIAFKPERLSGKVYVARPKYVDQDRWEHHHPDAIMVDTRFGPLPAQAAPKYIDDPNNLDDEE